MTFLRMAAGYRRRGELLRLRSLALREAARTAPFQEREQLLDRARELDGLYRNTIAAARFLERYYDRRYHDYGWRSR